MPVMDRILLSVKHFCGERLLCRSGIALKRLSISVGNALCGVPSGATILERHRGRSLQRRRGVLGLKFVISTLIGCWLICGASIAIADDLNITAGTEHQSTDQSLSHQLTRVILLRDYNTRVVLLGTTLLGIASGVVGTFMLLRKRALVGDVISHASLPGIAAAFLFIETAWPGHGKSLGGLLIGATISGLLGVGSVLLIRHFTRLKEDAALAIVLSVFFGAGIALMTVLQDMPSGNMAGLQGFIYGKAAAMVASDIELIAICAAVVLVLSTLLFKELAALCFDEGYSASQGWPVVGLDLILMGMVTVVTVIGLQSVGLLLVVGMLIIPAASARFWTDHLQSMTVVAAAIGGLAALLGVIASAVFANLAAGPIIILAGAVLFGISMLFSPKRGAVSRYIEHRTLQRQVNRQHLLRSCYEFVEPLLIAAEGSSDAVVVKSIPLDELQQRRTWSPRRLRRELVAAERDDLLWVTPEGACRLTVSGLERARRIAPESPLVGDVPD